MSSWADVFPLCSHQTGCKIIYDACHERGIYPAFNDPKDMYLKPKYHNYWSNLTHGCYYLDQAIINAIPNFYRQPFMLVDPVITKDYLDENDIEAIKQQYSPEKYTLETMLEDLGEEYIQYNNLSVRYSADWAMQRARMLNLMTIVDVFYDFINRTKISVKVKNFAAEGIVPYPHLSDYESYITSWENDEGTLITGRLVGGARSYLNGYDLRDDDKHNDGIIYLNSYKNYIEATEKISQSYEISVFELCSMTTLSEGSESYNDIVSLGTKNSLKIDEEFFKTYSSFETGGNAEKWKWHKSTFNLSQGFYGKTDFFSCGGTSKFPTIIDVNSIFPEAQKYWFSPTTLNGFKVFSCFVIANLTPGLQYYDPPTEN